MAELTSQALALVQLYVTKGHSMEHCAAALRPSRKERLHRVLLAAPLRLLVCVNPRSKGH